jgi:hypothetical protein
VSIGTTIPTSEMNTNGKMQYPSTLVDRPNERVDERFEEERGWSCSEDCCDASDGVMGGDINENMTQREVLPKAARPYM